MRSSENPFAEYITMLKRDARRRSEQRLRSLLFRDVPHIRFDDISKRLSEEARWRAALLRLASENAKRVENAGEVIELDLKAAKNEILLRIRKIQK